MNIDNIKVPTEQAADNGIIVDEHDYNIPYVEPEEECSGIVDSLPEKILLISKDGWERSFSFCREMQSKKNGLCVYRNSYLICDPKNPYIQPVSDTIKAILGSDYIPPMPKSTMALAYLSGVFFNRAEKMLNSRTLAALASMDHNDIKRYIQQTEGCDRITFSMSQYCHVTERKNPTKDTYKGILKRIAECTNLIGAILQDPTDLRSAEYFPVVEDLGYNNKMISFRSRYIAMLVARVIQSDITKDKDGNVGRISRSDGGRPLHSYQMVPPMLKGSNLYAMDIVGNICVLLDRAGKHPGVEPHITYDNLIRRSGTLKNKDIATIQRAFKEACKMLPDTNLGSKYPGIKFPDPSMSIIKSMIEDDTLTIPHNCTKCRFTHKQCKNGACKDEDPLKKTTS